MTNPFKDVLAFMRIGHPDKIATTPGFPSPAIDVLCENLVKEEYKELLDAWAEADLPLVADAIADLIYVLIQTAHSYGIPIEEVWNAVQAANMAKFPGGKVLRRENDGKIMKPEGWQPPDIASLLQSKSQLYVVRLYDGFDNQWIDITGPVSLAEAELVYADKTADGTVKTKFEDIDYYRIFPAETKMVFSEGFGET